MKRTHPAPSVALVGLDARGVALVRGALDARIALHAPLAYTDALTVLRKQRPGAVIVSLDADADAALLVGQALSQEFSGLTLVGLADRADGARLRVAMRAGFRDVVVLPDDAASLQRALAGAHPLAQDSHAGTVVACWGGKGGVGTTFLTVQLAAELSPVHRTCLLDFDFSMGDVAAFLDLAGGGGARGGAPTVSDLLRNADRLDERLLASLVTHHASRIHAVPQPTALDQREEPADDAIARVLAAASSAYQYVLVDCGSRLDGATLTTAAVADRLMLVTTPDVPSVRNTWRRLQLLERADIDLTRVHVVLNAWDPKLGGVGPADIALHLKRPVEAVIPHDRTALRSVNEGKLLRSLDARSPAAQAIAAAVGVITGAEVPAAPAGGTSPLGWLLGKRGEGR
jgi:pilus assembly protein CpaE